MRAVSIAFAIGMVAIGLDACQLVSGADALRFDAMSGSGGAGGIEGAGGTKMGAGGEAGPECFEPADCPGVETDCRMRTCEEGSCGTLDVAAGTACNDDGGELCNGQGACVACLGDGQCEMGVEVCDDQRCVPVVCANQQLDPGETDMDCGGPDCAPCADGASCDEPADCASGNCLASRGAGGAGGAAPGGTCGPCGDDAECQTDSTSWCDAQQQICQPARADGDVCGRDAQCANGHCVDGVCCASACDGLCEACRAVKTGKPNGQCAPIPKGSDPDGECALTLVCNGNRGCSIL